MMKESSGVDASNRKCRLVKAVGNGKTLLKLVSSFVTLHFVFNVDQVLLLFKIIIHAKNYVKGAIWVLQNALNCW